MTDAEFDALVGRLERLGAQQPGSYRLRLFLLAALGYAFLFAMLAMLGGALLLLGALAYEAHAGALVAKAMLPLLIVAWLVLRALWVRLDPPAGLPVARAEAPALFAELDGLRRGLNGPRIHEVLLTDDFNAGVTQVPRLGVFGWQKNYLVIGLPLMQALSLEQFRAVLGHEYGHLAGAHGKFGAWIYRVRQTWLQLLESFEQREGWLVKLFRRFFRWYSPFFAAYSFVLARAQEYEADRSAAQVAGARSAADALLSVSLKGRFLHEGFWPEVFGRVESEPQPTATPHRLMAERLNQSLGSPHAAARLQAALAEKAGTADTHPALTERLAALGEAPRLPPPVGETAAQRLLGASLPALLRRFDLHWQENVARSWQERHQYLRDARARMSELEGKAGAGALTLQEAWDRACLREEFDGAEAALPLYREVHARAPEDPAPLYAVGRLLLAKGDAAGLQPMEKAMALDASLAADGADWIAEYHAAEDRADEAETWRRRALETRQAQAEAEHERDVLKTSDRFVAHGLDDAALEALRGRLPAYPMLDKAYLVRKALKHGQEARPLYVLAVAYPASYLPWRKDGGLAKRLAAELSFPGEAMVVVVNGRGSPHAERRIGRAIRKVKGSLIYRR